MKKAGFNIIELTIFIIIIVSLFIISVIGGGFASEYRIRGNALIDSLLRVHGRAYVDSIFPDSEGSVYISNLAKQDSSIYADTAAIALNASLPDTLTPDSINVARLHAELSYFDTFIVVLPFKQMIDPDSMLLSSYRISQLISAATDNRPTFTQSGSSIDSAIQVIDSTKITDNKLGIGDVNNLGTLINERALFTAMVDSLKAKSTTTQLSDGLGTKKDTSNVEDDYHVSDNITISGTSYITGLNDSLADKTTGDDIKAAIEESLAVHFPLDTLELKSQWVTYIQNNQSNEADSARAASYADSSGKGPIASGSVRGTVKIGSGLNVTADGVLSASGVGGVAYTDSITIDGYHVPGDSIATQAQILQTVQEYLYLPIKYVADTSLTIDASDSIDVFLDTENGETVVVARAKSSAIGIQNLTFQTVVENPQEFIGLDSLNITYKTDDASEDSNKVNVYVGTLNRFTGTITLTDSATGLAGTDYASQGIYIGDNSIGKDDVVIVRFRVWSKSGNAVRIKRTYLTYGM